MALDLYTKIHNLESIEDCEKSCAEKEISANKFSLKIENDLTMTQHIRDK